MPHGSGFGPVGPVDASRNLPYDDAAFVRFGRFERFRASVATRPVSNDPGWVTITEACRLLGVSPSTVRRWGDSGMVRTFVTPGGHRRFSRAGLEALLPDRPTTRPALSDLGGTAGRMARGYRRASDEGPGRMPWVEELDETERERFRGYGRSIVTSLVAALDSDDPARRAEQLREAEDACAAYGRLARQGGLGASMTADLFLRFRRPFVTELGQLARRRELDARTTAALMADANTALDDLLLATVRGWEATPSSRRRGASTSPAAGRSPA